MENQEQEQKPNSTDLFITKLGEEVNYKLELNPDDRCWNLTLPVSFKGYKPMCSLCNFIIKNRKDRMYFCERDRIFLCKKCIVGEVVDGKHKSKHNCMRSEDLHEDKYINIYTED